MILGIYLVIPTSNPEVMLTQPIYDLKAIHANSENSDLIPFVDMTLEAGITVPHSQKSGEITGIHESLGAGVCSFDLNNDGWLDVLTVNGSGNTHYFGKPQWWQKNKSSVSVYLNNKNGTFSDISTQSNLLSQSQSMGCAIGDLDADGDQDVILVNRGQNELWENIGDSTFSKHTGFSKMHAENWARSAAIEDVDDDGKLDIYFVNFLSFKPNDQTFEGSAGFEGGRSANFSSSLHSGESYLAGHPLLNTCTKL